MAIKRADISEMIKIDMAGRELNQTDEAAAEERPDRPKPKPMESVKIRLDEGDYALLQDIAREQGSKASVLIRQAIKQIIKAHAVSLRQEAAGTWNGKQNYPDYTPYSN
jgi:hypothetical protein